MITRVGVRTDGLDAGRLIDVRDGRDLRAHLVQASDPEGSRAGAVTLRSAPPRRLDVGDQQHVWAVDVDVEPITRVLS